MEDWSCLAVVTVTFTAPLPAGAVAVSSSSRTQLTTFVAGKQPKATVVDAPNPLPEMVTEVPPPAGPESE